MDYSRLLEWLVPKMANRAVRLGSGSGVVMPHGASRSGHDQDRRQRGDEQSQSDSLALEHAPIQRRLQAADCSSDVRRKQLVAAKGAGVIGAEGQMMEKRCYSLSREEGWSMKTYAAKLPGLRIVLECKECHATIACKPDDWQRVPDTCPNCAQGRRLAEPNSMERQALESLRVGLKRVTDAIQSIPCDVRIEFDAESES